LRSKLLEKSSEEDLKSYTRKSSLIQAPRLKWSRTQVKDADICPDPRQNDPLLASPVAKEGPLRLDDSDDEQNGGAVPEEVDVISGVAVDRCKEKVTNKEKSEAKATRTIIGARRGYSPL